MLVVFFVNDKDQLVKFVGTKLLSSVKQVIKDSLIVTRYQSKSYKYCSVKNTMTLLKELSKKHDTLVISFGIRMLPYKYKQILLMASKTKQNIVFLKVLKGSKTWRVLKDGSLSFVNKRIADAGVFIIQSKYIKENNFKTFNELLKYLTDNKLIKGIFIKDWVFTNNIPRGS
ncbi:MAG: hypothetical protein ACTSYR_02200 [Candidatus Odinarchaeia archaeon]